MSSLNLIISSIKARYLSSFLSIMLTALGVMLAVLVILFAAHIETRTGNNAKGIDFVIGAKGSPLQLILSSVYHIDIPNGNISYKQARQWMEHPQVKNAIPLALGDSYKGFRIAGTNEDYIKLYGGSFSKGSIWERPFEAVAGSKTGLKVDDTFLGAHGLIDDGHNHDENPYKVTGVLKPTGTVLDRLILTGLDSVLLIHGLKPITESEHHDGHDHDEHEEHGHADELFEEDEHAHEEHQHLKKHNEPEITALLIKARSSAAIINLPRLINKDSNLQTAIPAYEMARLSSMLGLGSNTALLLSTILIIIAGLSIFSGLASALDNRLYDLAVMKVLGFSAARLFALILTEGLLLVFIGLICGLLLGHLTFYALIQTVEPLRISGANAAYFDIRELILALFICLAGIAAAIIPARRAAQIDAGDLLARGS